MISKFVVIVVVAAMAFSGCSPYVTTEPQQPVVVVPAQPGPEYVWRNGGWRWSPRRHDYIRTEGHWARRGNGSQWVDGHWINSSRGFRYVPGHWR